MALALACEQLLWSPQAERETTLTCNGSSTTTNSQLAHYKLLQVVSHRKTFIFTCLSGVRVVHVVKCVFSKNDVRFVSTPICCVGVSRIMLFVINYVYCCSTRFPYQMMFVSFISNTTGVICGAGTANSFGTPEFTPDF